MPEPSEPIATLRITAAVAPLQAEPRAGAPLVSQRLHGHVVVAFERRDAWWHVRGADDYPGWVHDGYAVVQRGTERCLRVPLPFGTDGDAGDATDPGRDGWRLCLGGDTAVNGDVVRLPLGALLAADDPRAEVLPVLDAAAVRTRFGATPAAIAHDAATLFAGAPYLWGGVSPWGCDCSGFVQSVFALHGIALPRDAWQQAEMGTAIDAVTGPLSDAAISALQPADLLFFSDRDDRRVTHVGIALGNDRYVHSAIARGGVRVERLRATDPVVQRLRAECVGGRRIVTPP
jgi:hypothetical protein